MTNLIWIGLIFLAYARPIDIYYRKTERVNGRIVKDIDYVKRLCGLVAVVLIVLGLLNV